MSVNHPISESDSDWDEEGFLPPGLQSDASEDSMSSSPGPALKTSSIAEEEDGEEEGEDEDEDDVGGTSRPSSKDPSIDHDEYAFEDNAEDASSEGAVLTHSFLSLPEGMEPPGPGGSNTPKKPKTQRKRTRKKSGSGESPKRRRRKQKVKERKEDGEEDEDGKPRKKSKGKGKSKNKPANRRRNIK